MQKLPEGAVTLNIVVTQAQLDWLNWNAGERKKSQFIRGLLRREITRLEKRKEKMSD
jgi:hypothetical protein